MTEQVVLRAPDYVLQCVADHPTGVLAGVFADLISAFDDKPWVGKQAS